MNLLISVIAILVIALLALGIAMSQAPAYILVGFIPYIVFAFFFCGFIYRIVKWVEIPRSFPHPHNVRPGQKPALDSKQSGGKPFRSLWRDR